MITLFIIGFVLSSFHSTSGISNITAYEGDDVEFRWTYTTTVDGIKWYKGTSSDETLMEWLSGTVTKYIENIEYINEPNSAGMTLLDVTLSQNGLYTVVVYKSSGAVEESYTYLEINPTSITPPMTSEFMSSGVVTVLMGTEKASSTEFDTSVVIRSAIANDSLITTEHITSSTSQTMSTSYGEDTNNNNDTDTDKTYTGLLTWQIVLIVAGVIITTILCIIIIIIKCLHGMDKKLQSFKLTDNHRYQRQDHLYQSPNVVHLNHGKVQCETLISMRHSPTLVKIDKYNNRYISSEVRPSVLHIRNKPNDLMFHCSKANIRTRYSSSYNRTSYRDMYESYPDYHL